MAAGERLHGATAFSELCYLEPEWKGVAVSRLAQVMVAAIQRIRTCRLLRSNIRREVLVSIDQEMAVLYPHFVTLNAGAGAVRVGELPRDEPKRAARAVYDWLCLPRSPLRSALAIFSMGGLFYAAQCREKGARAAIIYAPIHVCDFKEAAVVEPWDLPM